MPKYMRTIGIAIAFIIFMFIAYLLYENLAKDIQPGNSLTQGSNGAQPIEALDFTVLDYEGKKVQLSEYFGKPIVINFWATWCPYCVDEMALFNEMYEKYGEDIHFLMVNSTDGKRETVEKAKAYIEEEGFTFPVFFDSEGQATYAYEANSLPTSVFINKEGNVIAYQPGKLSDQMLQQGLDLILSK